MKKPNKIKKNAHLWQRHPDDWYVESSWVTAGMLEKVQFTGLIVDPCCGMGNTLDAAKAAGYDTHAMDIVMRGKVSERHLFQKQDFFADDRPLPNVISNPPYKYDEAFVQRAIDRSQRITAVLLSVRWANAGARSRWLESLPLRYVLAVSPRPSMPPGPVIEAGDKPGGGIQDYSWYIFFRGYTGKPEFGWARRPKIAKL